MSDRWHSPLHLADDMSPLEPLQPLVQVKIVDRVVVSFRQNQLRLRERTCGNVATRR